MDWKQQSKSVGILLLLSLASDCPVLPQGVEWASAYYPEHRILIIIDYSAGTRLTLIHILFELRRSYV